MIIIGISAYYHDSAVAVIKDGKIIFAIEEERLSRIKHDYTFPLKALDFCLQQTSLKTSDIDVIAYYEKPLLKFERIIQTFTETYPYSFSPFYKSIPEQLSQKIKVEKTIRNHLNFKKKIFFIPHHLSHASATYFTSGFSSSPILTVDGVGEYTTTCLWRAQGNNITPLKSINFPHSLGLLYSTFTAFLGFKVNEDEYKMMGLSAYGKPNYLSQIKKIIEINSDGSFKLNLNYFSFREEFKMWNSEFELLFGNPRKSNEPVMQKHKDIAYSIQHVTEEIYFKLLNHLSTIVPSNHVCIAGGVALNALANGKIYNNTPFKNVFIYGPSGDNGAAIGAALFAYYSQNKYQHSARQTDLKLGSNYTNEEIRSVLEKPNLSFEYFPKKADLIKKVAKLLSQNKIIGWFNDRMEFGPRALGSRSILANPRDRSMKNKVNLVKKREQFRPFAGAILEEYVADYFEVPAKNYSAPHMNFCFPVKKEKLSEITAIVHEDKTCRIQTVNKSDGDFYDLIKEFHNITGVPCILNTSFNVKGEPIVENPQQAVKDFISSKMDYQVLGEYLLTRNHFMNKQIVI